MNARQAIDDGAHSWSANVDTSLNFKSVFVASNRPYATFAKHLHRGVWAERLSLTCFALLEVFQSAVLNGARGPMVERTTRCRYIPGATVQSEWDKFWCKVRQIGTSVEFSCFFFFFVFLITCHASNICILSHFLCLAIYIFDYLHMPSTVASSLYWIGLYRQQTHNQFD